MMPVTGFLLTQAGLGPAPGTGRLGEPGPQEAQADSESDSDAEAQAHRATQASLSLPVSSIGFQVASTSHGSLPVTRRP